ncbi:MAG: flagellar motor switch protein FliN [Phycisphaeraceae bacterium]|nr:flagellar motor switch protein FliN [Phycisphaeraceae bacterium]
MADPAPQPASSPTPQAPESLAEAALNAAQQAVTSLGQEAGVAGSAAGGVQPFEPAPLTKPDSADAPAKGIDLLSDVNLNVKIELGRTRMLVEDVLKLNEGAVVELDKLAGDPVDVYVNDRHIARGEVLVLNDNFCVRINEIINQVGDAEGRSV